MNTASKPKAFSRLGVSFILFFCFAAVHSALAQTQFLNFMSDVYASGDTNGQISPLCIATADINGDGHMDIICANGANKSVMILTNNGLGYFGSNALFSLSTDAESVAAADVNGDGWPDLVVADFNNPGTLTIWTNNRAGVFGFNATLPTGYNPNCVVAADLNGDHKVDLICADEYANSLTVFLNNGAGDFSSNATLNAGGNCTSFIAADLDGDGKMDLVALDEYVNMLIIFTNDGAGNLASNSTIYVSGEPSSVAAVDLYGTGKLALVTANYDYFSGNTLTVFTNNGSGVFSSNATILTGPAPITVIAADVSGDGRQDLVCAYDGGYTGMIEIFTNNGNGGFGSNTVVSVGSTPICLAAADINNDGKLDVITGDASDLTVVTQIGFTGWMYSEISQVDSIAVVDAYKNGLPDLVTANLVTSGNRGSTLTVFTNTGFGHFGSNATLNVGSAPVFVTTADINGDGWPDLISANDGGVGTISVLINDTHGAFAASQTIELSDSDSTDGSPTGIAPIDINGETCLAIPGAGRFLLYTNDGIGFLSSNALLTLGNDPYYAVAADVNGDGLEDLICSYDLSGKQNDGNGTLLVLLNDGNGGFVSNALYEVGPQPQAVIAKDINGDGHVDLLALCTSLNQVIVLTNNGAGGFVSNASYFAGYEVVSMAMADINGDGSPDLIFAGNGTPPMITMLTNDGVGIFGFYASFAVNLNSAAATFVTAADLNGDGKPDFVLTTSDGTMTVFLNTITFPTKPTKPVLNVGQIGANLVLSWSASVTNVVVQTNSSLASPNWAVATYPVVTLGANQSVTIPPPSNTLFFRLSQE